TQKNISIILDRNGKQLAYRCAARYLSKIGVIDDLFDCKVYPGYIEHITYEAPADRKSSITSIEDLVPVKKRIPFSSQPFLFGQDMIDQWTLLTRHTNIEELTWAEVPVYIPEQKKIMILDIFGGDTENVEDVVCKRIEIPFLDIKLWVSFKGDLMKAEISSQRTQIVRSGPEVLQLKADEDSLDWSIRGKGVPLPE
ncbi:MAG: hypothetical protein QGH40_11485, partial [bacterium]|nr:hypothetical protein [bacterium]